jgi:hypothetical protein
MSGDRSGWSGPITVVAALAALIISVIALSEVDEGGGAESAKRVQSGATAAESAPTPIAVTLGPTTGSSPGRR